MKIIKPKQRSNKSKQLQRSEDSMDTSDVYVSSSKSGSLSKSYDLKPKERGQRKPPSRNRPDRSFKDKPEFEGEFDFDTSKLEAMPKEELIAPLHESKKRRRTELRAEKRNEPLSLVTDPAKKEFNEIFAQGLRMLAMREHSVREITNKLLAKSKASIAKRSDQQGGEEIFDSSKIFNTVYAVVDELLEKKYLSNERFTETYVRSRANRGFGPVKIKSELKDKGISSGLIQDHLDQGSSLWFDNAKSEYQKKFGSTPVENYNVWTKRARFLQSRGFTMEQIHCVVTPVDNEF